MPKKPPQSTQVKFVNFKLPSVVHWSCTPDIPQTELGIVQEFLELSDDGIKVSFGSKASRQGYSVSVTVPDPGDAYEMSCASFWDGNRYDAWAAAYIVIFIFQVTQRGWALAQEEVDKYAKEVQGELIEYRRSKR